MSVTTHIGIAPQDLTHVFSMFPTATTDVDSWHVWGEPLNTPAHFHGIDTLHITIPGDVSEKVISLAKSLQFHPQVMQNESGEPTGIFAVVTDVYDWSIVDSIVWENDIQDQPTPVTETFSNKVAAYDAEYFFPDDLEPVDHEELWDLLTPFIATLLEGRVILRREDAEDRAHQLDGTGPYAD